MLPATQHSPSWRGDPCDLSPSQVDLTLGGGGGSIQPVGTANLTFKHVCRTWQHVWKPDDICPFAVTVARSSVTEQKHLCVWHSPPF